MQVSEQWLMVAVMYCVYIWEDITHVLVIWSTYSINISEAI